MKEYQIYKVEGNFRGVIYRYNSLFYNKNTKRHSTLGKKMSSKASIFRDFFKK
jgi:hypothetical protein